MRKHLGILAAAAAVLVSAPASASVFDYGVYASGGASVSGGSLGRVAAGVLVNLDGAGASNVSASVAATAALSAQAADFSGKLGARAGTGGLVRLLGTDTLLGTTAGVNVFNLTAAQFNGLSALAVASLGAGAVVNVSGDAIQSSLRLGLGTALPGNVLFNFADATSVVLTDANLGGSILAPKAAVTLRGGSVAGTVVGASVDARGTLVGGRGFVAVDIDATSPVQAAAVPEPASWAAMILGLGASGAVLRRRRRPAGSRPAAA